MTRLWRRSNFGANFRFLRKKWTSDLPNRVASFGTSNQKEQCPENGGCGKTSHLNVSKYFFTTLATWGRALSWRRITLLCLCSTVFLAMHGSNESIVADTEIVRNGIIRFQKLTVNKTLLIPLDTEHDLWIFHECSAVMLMLRSMATIELSIVFFLLGIVVEYSLLISSHNLTQKTFSLLS